LARIISVRITDEMERLIDEIIKVKGAKARSEVIREALEIGLKKIIEDEKRRSEVRNLLEDIIRNKKFLSSSKALRWKRHELYRH